MSSMEGYVVCVSLITAWIGIFPSSSESQTVCPDLTCGAVNGTNYCPFGFDLDPVTGCQTCVCFDPCVSHCPQDLACRVTNADCSRSRSCNLECYQDACTKSASGCHIVPSPPTCVDLQCPSSTSCRNIGFNCDPSCSDQFYGCVAKTDIEGYCPDTSAMYPTRSTCEILDLNNCNEDRNCPGQKCCKTLCGKRCLDPTPGKPVCQNAYMKCPTLATDCIQSGGSLELDSNGCELCLCNKAGNDACAGKTCPVGYSCKSDCSKDPCFTWCQQTCTPFPCLKTMFCPNGFLKDAAGCELCQCNTNTPPKDCSMLSCETGKICKMVPVPCTTPPCHQYPACLDNVKNGTCPSDPNTAVCLTNQDNCTYDEDCPYLQKCCDRACGKECVDPLDDNGCPMQICTADINQCAYGQAKDHNGCHICECRDPCKDVTCDGGKECTVSSSNCITGTCTYSASCQCAFEASDCLPKCPYGYSRNATSGCYTCTCLPDPCKTMCSANQRCEIADERVCPDDVTDTELCPVKAQCVNCSDIECGALCGGPSTKRNADDGCLECLCDECRAKSCSSVCTGQYRETKGPDGCLICQCTDSGNSGCPTLTCNNTCPSGYETNDQGCKTCQCASICKDYVCPDGQTCRTISDSQVICEDSSGSSLQCPATHTDSLLDSSCYALSKCSKDADCGSDKCCLLQCGWRCTPPVQTDPTTVVIHPGACPKNPVNFPCYSYRFMCNTDADCKSDYEKCCLRGCNKLCVRALRNVNTGSTFKSGYCKFPEERWGSVLRKYFRQGRNNCQSHSDCPGENMCCLSVDGKSHTVARKCLAPEAQDWTDQARSSEVVVLVKAIYNKSNKK